MREIQRGSGEVRGGRRERDRSGRERLRERKRGRLLRAEDCVTLYHGTGLEITH